MSNPITSSLNWLIFKNEDIQKAREILKELGPDSTVDSIGLGLPVEEISNVLFPATSTLHTRLRYQIFVSAIMYKMYFEAARKPLRNPEKRLRELEVNLMNTLLENDEKGGVVGRLSKEGLKYWPSQTYWGAVNTMRFLSKKSLGRAEIFSDLAKKNELHIVNDDGEIEERQRRLIDPDQEFKKISLHMFNGDSFDASTNFNLTKSEALFILRKLEETELGKNTLLYQWSRLSISKLGQIKDFISCPPCDHVELDDLIFQAKNYSYMAMGISHAYRYALCSHKANVINGIQKEEWSTYAKNNIDNLSRWIKQHHKLKNWDIESLDKAIKRFAPTSKIDAKLSEMLREFCAIWKAVKSPTAFAKSFMSVAKSQEQFRRGNRSHFNDPYMSIPENTKGEIYRDWLYDYRFAQGYNNALDIATALRSRK